MTDRYRYAPSGRAATFNNPARTSLPTSIGYSSLYAGDMHIIPSSGRHQAPPRGYSVSSTSSGAPTATRTYAVTQDPRSMRPTTRDVSRHRSSTLDSNSSRPPVIVMTTSQGKDRPHATSSHTSNARSGSPIRDDYRASEGQFFTQPASSIRSRSHARQYSDQFDNDDYARIRERSDNLLREEPYRPSRSSVIYANNPRQSSANIDYGDEGYQYTNAGELARYDLDHSGPSRSRRRESMDRGYYRPNINYNTDQRVLNVNTSPDMGRNYNMNTSRPYESRGGPPPTTRGFDKIQPREYYDAPRDVPPVAPAPPDPAPVSHLEVAGTIPEGRRARPVSLYQEAAPRSKHHDDYHRSREDERNMREFRDRDHAQDTERYDAPYFHDDRVMTRGFGIRTEPVDDFDDRRERRREYRVEEPKKRSDEELVRDTERDERRRSRRDSRDGRRERRESKRGSDDDEKERTRFRDKVTAGLGIAATAMGLTPSSAKDDDKREKEKETRRRRESDEDRDQRRASDEPRDRRRESETYDHPRAPDRSRSRHGDHERRDSKDDVDSKERKRRDIDPRKSSEAVIVSASDSDEGKKASRRPRASIAFDPNDASDIKQLKEQLAAMKTSDKETKEQPVIVETNRTRSSSPTKESRPAKESKTPSPSIKDANVIVKEAKATKETRDLPPSPRDESRGRELVVPPPEDKEAAQKEKQVRVVSPPRDKREDKPIKGILKQPSAKFPEEPNPLREGVAPHKEDKKIKEAPAGAKWTKISRKVVNPEALTIGKERFEVRDDFVIVLRVLSKEEIQAYAAATQVLRERRRNEDDDDRDRDHDHDREREREREHNHKSDRDYDRDYDRDEEEKRKHHRHRRHRDDEDDRDDKDRDRDRRRRHRDDDEYESRSRDVDSHHHHHRSHRDREAVLEA